MIDKAALSILQHTVDLLIKARGAETYRSDIRCQLLRLEAKSFIISLRFDTCIHLEPTTTQSCLLIRRIH